MDTRPLDESAIFSIERPAPNLMTYYLLSSFVLGPLFFILLIPLYFRYHTLRYRFDEEGISMRWGILFRREINLTYARIQDIHLRSNFVERWLNLARVEVQTASGSRRDDPRGTARVRGNPRLPLHAHAGQPRPAEDSDAGADGERQGRYSGNAGPCPGPS
jgi:uncharacterized membrane protein YdbT with pleckstrin-like domain